MATKPLSDLTATWNAGGTTFTAIKMNATDTASAAGSLLMDLQVGGVSQFSVSKSGAATARAQLIAPVFTVSGGGGALLNSNGISVGSAASVLFSSTTSSAGSADLSLTRDAANTLAQRNSTNAQAFRVYNTFTDASNYERLVFRWSSNIGGIFTDQAGTGSSRNLQMGTLGLADIMLATNGSTRFRVSSAGHLLAEADNTYDIGASGANRPRNVYVANDVIAGGIIDATGFIRGATIGLTDGVSAPAAVSGRARIYIDTADGDLKIIFGDGTIKTIVTDT